MAIIPLQKIRIILHESIKQDLLAYLQKNSVLDINDLTQEDESHSPSEELIAKAELQLAELQFTIDYLKPHFVSQKKGLAAALAGDSVEANCEMLKEVVAHYDFEAVIEKIKALEDRKIEIQNTLLQLTEKKKILLPWKNLKLQLNEVKESQHTKLLLGSIDIQDKEIFASEIRKTSINTSIQFISHNNSEAFLSILLLKKEEETVRAILQDFSFYEANLLDIDMTAHDALNEIKEEKTTLQKELSTIEKEIKSLAQSDLEKLKIIFDTTQSEKAKLSAAKNLQYTTSTAVIEGWTPERNVRHLESEIKQQFPLTDFSLIEANNGEEPPVYLENNAAVQPFETVTKLYGLPSHREIDPTASLAPFFAFFFGFCLTDAGYGLLLALICFFVIKIGRIPKNEQGLLRLLIYGGFATIVLGILFGGWFGLNPEHMPTWLTKEVTIDGQTQVFFIGQVLNPIQSALMLLGFAWGLGFFQVMFGKVLSGIVLLKQGKYVAALLDGFSYAILLLSVGLYGASMQVPSLEYLQQPSYYILMVTAIVLVLTQGREAKGIFMKFAKGLLSLYSLVGFMTDILSYARLAALGLATGIIASSFNEMAYIFGGMVPYVGFIVTGLIMIVGHLFNLFLNTIGAFIQSARLQFIEFFGQFLEGGGKEFNPLQKKYTYIKKES